MAGLLKALFWRAQSDDFSKVRDDISSPAAEALDRVMRLARLGLEGGTLRAAFESLNAHQVTTDEIAALAPLRDRSQAFSHHYALRLAIPLPLALVEKGDGESAAIHLFESWRRGNAQALERLADLCLLYPAGAARIKPALERRIAREPDAPTLVQEINTAIQSHNLVLHRNVVQSGGIGSWRHANTPWHPAFTLSPVAP